MKNKTNKFSFLEIEITKNIIATCEIKKNKFKKNIFLSILKNFIFAGINEM